MKKNIMIQKITYWHITVSRHSEKSIPSWSGFQQLLAETPPKATIGYSPPIRAPPTEMSVIYAFIDTAFKILKELEKEKCLLKRIKLYIPYRSWQVAYHAI